MSHGILKARESHSVLVGGAVVSIYTKGLYRSGDLDLITENRTCCPRPWQKSDSCLPNRVISSIPSAIISFWSFPKDRSNWENNIR